MQKLILICMSYIREVPKILVCQFRMLFLSLVSYIHYGFEILFHTRLKILIFFLPFPSLETHV